MEKLKVIDGGIYEGERALFQTKNALIKNATFQNGESPLKESRNIEVTSTTFRWKYPLWYCDNAKVHDVIFEETAKSGIWYTNNSTFSNCLVKAPKEFRRCDNIVVENSSFLDAKETMRKCTNIKLQNVKVVGDYLLMNSENIEVENLDLDGNYFVDGGKNIIVKNSRLNSKDAFWNCENVTIIASTIIGEYFGWNSKNITLINCHVESNQGFCYMENVKLINCTLKNTTLSFEYSTVDAEINSRIDSVKNPISGRIISKGIDELITDDCDITKTEIIIKK